MSGLLLESLFFCSLAEFEKKKKEKARREQEKERRQEEEREERRKAEQVLWLIFFPRNLGSLCLKIVVMAALNRITRGSWTRQGMVALGRGAGKGQIAPISCFYLSGDWQGG